MPAKYNKHLSSGTGDTEYGMQLSFGQTSTPIKIEHEAHLYEYLSIKETFNIFAMCMTVSVSGWQMYCTITCNSNNVNKTQITI